MDVVVKEQPYSPMSLKHQVLIDTGRLYHSHMITIIVRLVVVCLFEWSMLRVLGKIFPTFKWRSLTLLTPVAYL